MRKSAAAPVRAVEAESPSTERAQKRKAPNLPWAEMKTDTEDTKYFALHDKVDIKNFLAGYAQNNKDIHQHVLKRFSTVRVAPRPCSTAPMQHRAHSHMPFAGARRQTLSCTRCSRA